MLTTSRRTVQLIRWVPLEGLVWTGWFACLLAVHWWSRAAQSDWELIWAVGLLYGLVTLTWLMHHQCRLRVVTWVGRHLRNLSRRVHHFGLVVGVDFREDPPLTKRFPRRRLISLGVVGLGLMLSVTFARYLPSGLWKSLHAVSPVLASVLLAVSWGLLALATLVLITQCQVFSMWLFRLVRGRDLATVDAMMAQQNPNRRDMSLAMVYSIGIVLMAAVTPTWTPLVVMVVSLLGQVILAVLPRRPQLSILWRSRSETGPGNVISLSSFFLTVNLMLVTMGMLVFMLTNGDRLLDLASKDVSPVTASFGFAFSWTIAALLPLLLGFNATSCYNGYMRNPTHPSPTMVHITGLDPSLHRSAEALQSAGMQVVFAPQARQKGHVPLKIVAHPELAVDLSPIAELLADPSEKTRWPLAITVDQLSDPHLLGKIVRRDEVQRRRMLLSGLRTTFKLARQRASRGVGLLLAPHLWYVDALVRDDDDRTPFSSIYAGPLYRHILPLPARHHFYQVMQSAQLDLIFVENSVKYRQLKSVLRMLFEHYDVHGNNPRRITEHAFFGLQAVKVFIHDVTPTEPFENETYPEPDFDSVGRARILHIFKDRGEDEELVEPPVEYDWLDIGPRELQPV